jgi:hypothetical protein
LDGNPCSSRNVRSCRRILLASDAAADGFEFKAGVLRSFNGRAHGLARE